MTTPVDFKYRAFLSYAHADVAWAKRLHRQLEGFKIDKDLAGRETARGPVPKALRPIFRDREEFTGGHSLADATIAALDASAALIVLCSPVSATRPAVNEEVRLFRARHPDRPVIPVIVDGTWPDNFPPALRFEIAADGTVSDRPFNILGTDLRETGDGRTLGFSKIVAGLVGVGTDEIVRRSEREQRRRLRNWIGGLSTVAVALAGLTVWAEFNRREAVTQRQVADQRRQEAERNFALAKYAADRLVFDIAQGLRDQEGMRSENVAKILGTARGTFDKLAEAAPDNLELQRSRAVMLAQFGDTHVAQGNLPAALDAFNSALRISKRLAEASPGNTGWQRDVSVSHDRIGDVLVTQGRLPSALDAFKASLAITERLAASDSRNAYWQRDLALWQEKIGNVLVARGNLSAALDAFKVSLAIAERLAAFAPGNAGWQRDLSVSYNKIGNVLVQQGNLPAALDAYKAAFVIAERLAKADSGNMGWQRDLSISHNKIGGVLRDLGNLPAALDAYKAAFAIDERLAKADPGNAEWQRDLSVSKDRIGDVFRVQGDLPAAFDAFNASLAIKERLAKSDSGNAGWQHDVVLSLQRIGSIAVSQGDKAAAPTAYERGRDIMQRLVRVAPDHAAFQKDAAWFEARLKALE